MLMLGLGARLKLAYLVGPTRLESKRGARSCATFGKLPRTRIDVSIHQRQGGPVGEWQERVNMPAGVCS